MTLSMPLRTAPEPSQRPAAAMFCMIMASAAGLAVIPTTSFASLAYIHVSRADMLALLIVTLIVAGSIACLAIQHDGQVRMLEDAVPTDPLTGLISPHHLALSLKQAAATGAAGEPESSVIVFEIDHLDRIRNASGHGFGDLVIRWVAAFTFARLRSPFDRLARIEDGLFIAVLSDTTMAQAEIFSGRLLSDLQAASDQLSAKGHRLTLSFGIAPLASRRRFDEARDEAFMALYEARRFGRNQVRSRYSGVLFGESVS